MYKNKSHHWNFVFDALPALFHGQTDGFMKYLDKDGAKFLKFWWDHVGDRLPEEKRVTPGGLTYEVETIDAKTRLVIITLPSPREDGEAYFVAGIARPERRFAFVRLPTTTMYVLLRDDKVEHANKTSFGELTPRGNFRPRGIGLKADKLDFKRVVKQKIYPTKKKG